MMELSYLFPTIVVLLGSHTDFYEIYDHYRDCYRTDLLGDNWEIGAGSGKSARLTRVRSGIISWLVY